MLVVSFSHFFNSSRFDYFIANAQTHLWHSWERQHFAEICLLRWISLTLYGISETSSSLQFQPMVWLGFHSLFTSNIHMDAFDARLVENVLELRLTTVFSLSRLFFLSATRSRYMCLQFIHYTNGLKHVAAIEIPLNVIKWMTLCSVSI